jgi:hypothetical protein
MPRLRQLARTCGILASSLLWLASPAGAEAETCEPGSTGPVSLILLQSAGAVHELAAALRGTVITRDATTVVFADGRIISSDVGKVGDHMNALGWSSRSIDMMASFPARRARPRGRSG